jgi:hypothetical protein
MSNVMSGRIAAGVPTLAARAKSTEFQPIRAGASGG